MAVHMQEAGKTVNQAKNDEVPDEKKVEDGEVVIDPWLKKARDAYRNSTDYFDSSIRKTIERNLAHFNNRHAPGSKYYTEAYKYRAKGFRPKTRSVVRKNEAQAAVALFSTSDAVYVAPENDADKAQVVSAEIVQQLLQYRLTNTIPWFQTAMGGCQDALVSGVVISHQCWKYEEAFIPDPEQEMEVEQIDPIYDEEGNEIEIDAPERPIAERTGRFEILTDTPDIELRPVENVRFCPSADWRDPINSSPYLIDRIPMTIEEVKRMSQQLEKTSVPWYEIDESDLRLGLTEDYDPVRQQRDGSREDPNDRHHSDTDFDTVWIHRNIVRVDGIDYLYYTLGEYRMLSDPIPLHDEYPWLKRNKRPYTMGFINIETHKVYPESLAGLATNLQQEANEINNQRRDNVQLVLNRRSYVRRGAQIDYRTLTRSIPGGVVEMDDPNRDIKTDAPADVTGSSYQEQDRINMDFDDLTGAFSTSSVGSNRQLNETVGGMEMMSQGADTLTEYQLRTFVETWVEPTLKQIIQLEQYYETDQAVLALVGDQAKLWQRYGIDRVTDRMLQGSMNVQVNVGFGVTNPRQRIERMALGLNTVLSFQPQMAQRINGDEIAKEVFGALGYRGHTRFFPEPDPNAPPPEQQPDPSIVAEQMRQEGQMKLEQLRFQNNMKLKEVENQLKLMEMKGKHMDQTEERKLKQILAQLEWQGNIMDLAAKEKMSFEQIKAKLGELSIKERGANERFLAEKQFAETTGEGRGI